MWKLGSAGFLASSALLLDCWDGEQPGQAWLLRGVGGGGGPWNKQEGLPRSQTGSLGT